MHLRTVLLLLRLKSVVYIVTHLKTGARCKMNINPATNAVNDCVFTVDGELRNYSSISLVLRFV